uniref:Copper-containing nitrite reductase n=1 Tax=Macrostomum lignano TaxID=282301 RepID=A0A1I8FC27_9PLAT
HRPADGHQLHQREVGGQNSDNFHRVQAAGPRDHHHSRLHSRWQRLQQQPAGRIRGLGHQWQNPGLRVLRRFLGLRRMVRGIGKSGSMQLLLLMSSNI